MRQKFLGWGYVIARYVARRAALRDTALRSEGRAAASVTWRRRGKTTRGGLTPRAGLHRLQWLLPWHQPNAHAVEGDGDYGGILDNDKDWLIESLLELSKN